MERECICAELQKSKATRTAARRRLADRTFQVIALAAVTLAFLLLAALLVDTVLDGWPRLRWKFLTSFPSRFPEEAGILSALIGSLYLMALTGIFAFPLGVGAAIYLEEYGRRNRITRFIELNIANLAGVPSIIYGLLGLQLFVRMMRLDRSLLAGALTMALLILPIIIIASREALRAVPTCIRDASLALGATRWQTIRRQVLPLALPGILTGSILAFSRAIGETAPLITMGALTYVAFLPDGLRSPFTALPIQAFNWTSRPQEEFHANAAAAIIVLLAMLLAMNALAVWLRNRFQKRLQ
ncbi:MAG: phosphate ABC transporter, permease protein PstA [Armatimonadetes bacterium RBG_16_58_9]|nr:MAG: phosphate ABC transporter, permease protein PstA [Armatimonadetes bacterium RBG_16_58_9]